MTEKEEQDFNPYLFNLMTMFAQSAWCQLGKVPSPINNKICRGSRFGLSPLCRC